MLLIHIPIHFYNVALTVFTLLIALIPFTGKVYDARWRWFARFTFKGYLVIVLALLSVPVVYFKDLESDYQEKIKSDRLNLEKIKVEKELRKMNNETIVQIIGSVTTSLEKYNLKYDAEQKEIVKIVRDSAKSTQHITPPEIYIDDLVLKKTPKDTLLINYTIISKSATAYNVSLSAYYMVIQKNGFYSLVRPSYSDNPTITPNFILKNTHIPPDHGIFIEKKFFYLYRPESPLSVFFIIIKGEYFDINNKKYQFKDIQYYDFEKQFSGTANPVIYDKVLVFLKKKGIDF